jgi:lysophospholipase L1-like esterase
LARLSTFSKSSLIGLAFLVSACGGAGPSPVAIDAPSVLPEAGQAHFKKRVEAISAEKPIASGTVLIGDSITEAWMWQRDADTYPFQRPVGNHGVGWDSTEGAISRLPLVEPSAPDKIFLKIGTNDISWGVSLADMAEDFDTLLSRLREQEPQAQIYVQSVLPRESDKLEKIARVNAMQADLTKKHGAIYIDLTDVFAQSDGTLRAEFTEDGLHLNDAGYAVWGAALQPYAG